MKTQIKRALSLILATMMTATMFSGCGSSASTASAAGGASAAASKPASTEKATITYYYDAAFAESTKKVVADFESENPNIKVTLVDLPAESNKKLQTISTILQAQDSSMDVFEMDSTWPLTFISAGWTEPVDDVFTKDDIKGFFDGPIAANTYDGRLYSAPLYMDAGILLYRKDLLDKYGYQPPKTWDELAKISKDIMSKEPSIKNGYSSGWKQYEALTCSAMEFIWGYGGDVLDDSGKVIMDSPEAIKGLQRMHDLTYVDKITDPGINGYKWSDSRVPFYSGNTLFIRDWPTAMAGANDPSTSKVAGKVAMAPIPGGKDASTNYNTLGGWSVGISAFSKNKDAAKTFLKYITGAKAQKTRALLMGLMPTSPSVYDDAEVLQKLPYFATLKEVAKNSKSRPKTAYYAELSAILQQGFASVLANTTTPEKALQDMKPKIEEIMKR